jgi:hypothetical protein
MLCNICEIDAAFTQWAMDEDACVMRWSINFTGISTGKIADLY